MQKIKDNLSLVLILLLSLLIIWPLFLPGYFSHHDDLQVMRIFEIRKCFEDLQIPCRWVPDMGYGNGFPLFNYYSVFPYYLGGLLSFFFGFIVSAKILFLIPLILGGLSMYLLASYLFDKWAGLLSGVLYLFAPYRALDSYVRGAVAESFALSIIPLVFYFSLKLIKTKKLQDFLGLSISLVAFLTSHNIMTLLFVPILIMWVVIFLYLENPKHKLLIFLSIGLGFGLAAFFILPAFFEKSLVQSETLTKFDLDFRVHFVAVKQLFERLWGYGASTYGPNDSISFQIGIPHFILAFLILPVLLLKKVKWFTNLFNQSEIFGKKIIIFLILGTYFVSLFMMHNKSAFVWESIPILQYTQFPWRFLSLSIFTSSLLGGFLAFIINRKFGLMFVFSLCLLTTLLNFQYFRPKEFYYSLTDQQKLSGDLWREQQRAGILDYLPKTATEALEPAADSPIVTLGKVEITDFKKLSNKWSFNIDVAEKSQIEVPVYDFPNWRVWANNTSIKHTNKNHIGRIGIELESGQHTVVGKFKDTPVRTLANFITLFSIVGLVVIFKYGKIFK